MDNKRTPREIRQEMFKKCSVNGLGWSIPDLANEIEQAIAAERDAGVDMRISAEIYKRERDEAREAAKQWKDTSNAQEESLQMYRKTRDQLREENAFQKSELETAHKDHVQLMGKYGKALEENARMVEALKQIVDDGWFRNAYMPADNEQDRRYILIDCMNHIFSISNKALSQTPLTQKHLLVREAERAVIEWAWKYETANDPECLKFMLEALKVLDQREKEVEAS